MNFSYVGKRILLAVPTLAGITLIAFFLLKALPGDPVQGIAGERADAETIARLRRDLGIGASWPRQYAGYLKLLLRGEFGRSYYTDRSVGADIAAKLPNTLRLACAAMLVSVTLGVAMGVLMAALQGTWVDRCCLVLVTGGAAVPVFWLGLLLMLVFCFLLKILPPAGTGGLAFLVLPATTLGLNAAASLARITRASMIEVLSQPYITTARAKGLSRRAVLMRHALKNALVPVLTMIGLDFGSFLNGSVLTETIFGWDGIGRYAVEAIFRRDYPVIMGCVVTGAALFVAINLLTDVAYSLCDPKIRHSREA